MKRSTRQARVVLAIVVAGLLLVSIAALLFVTESAFRVWESLQKTPWLFKFLFSGGLLALSLMAAWVIWLLLWPRRTKPEKPQPPLSEQALQQRLEEAESRGIDVAQSRRELEMLQQRRSGGDIYIATFGDISSGKSSLINTLVPQAKAQTDVRGGTTQTVKRYHWRSTAGDSVVLADVPGLDQAGGTDQQAEQEALRAHFVIYVCEGDLTRSQYQSLRQLLTFHKPTIVAINKTDRYSAQEQEAIRARVRQRLQSHAGWVAVVPIQAGGTRDVIRVHPDGREEVASHAVPGDVDALRLQLQRFLDLDRRKLEQLRDSAVFMLAQQQLSESETTHRFTQAQEIVRRSTRKAVLGALAAVSPGTDIIIQGYLGFEMVKSICALYKIPVRDVDIDAFLESAQGRVNRSLTVLLAIAGNGLKAFPGLGTVAGGLVHAVAYGMIFDTLGHTLVKTLQHRREFHTLPADVEFDSLLTEGLQQPLQRVIQLVLDAKKSDE